MVSSTSDGGGEVVEFPKTAEERKALRKAKQTVEQQKLVNLFIDEASNDALFAAADGTAFADLIVGGHRETWPVRSKPFRFAYVRYLKRQSERLAAEGNLLAAWAVGPGLKKSAINAAIDDFEMRAICAPVAREVHVRVAAYGDDIYIDLGDPAWHAVRITAMDWSIVQNPPVRFRRSTGMRALPFPESGTPIDKLKPFLNVPDGDFVLVVAWLLAALRPAGPYPILVLIGEQGAAKTSLMRLLRSLFDPSEAPTCALPFSGRDLFIAAHNSHALMFENISKLSDQMSDHICRVATGGGVRMKTLFKDTDETVLCGARPIAMEGIANFVVRGDLMDRSIILSPQSMVDRRTEHDLRKAFERLQPGLFGALLDHLVRGVRELPNTHLADLPRMADFCQFGVACGLDGFEAAYRDNRQSAIDTALEHDPLARAVRALMAKRVTWQGTATELLDLFGPAIRITNARGLSSELRRLAPMLRTIGIDVQWPSRTTDARGIVIVRIL